MFCRRFHARSLAAAFGAVAALSACSPTVDQRGNLPEADKLAAIHPGSTTKDQVVKILGTPSSTGVFNDNSWYYISRKTEQVAFFEPDVVDQQVFIVSFDDRGVVKAVNHRTLADGRSIQPAPGATPAPGRELTFLEQIIGNVGRFSKGGGGGGGGTGRTGGPTTGPSPNGGP